MDTPVPEQLVPTRSFRVEDVFHHSYRALVVQLYGVTGSFDEAEDVVQEAFVRAAGAGRRFLRVDNPEAWLRTTAINVHRSRWRKLRNGQRARDLMPTPRDPEALAEALAGLLDNPARLAAMGEAAAASARRYAWPVVAGEVAEVYRAALAG